MKGASKNMLEQKDTNKIKETAEEFFEKMTMPASGMEVNLSSEKKIPRVQLTQSKKTGILLI